MARQPSSLRAPQTSPRARGRNRAMARARGRNRAMARARGQSRVMARARGGGRRRGRRRTRSKRGAGHASEYKNCKLLFTFLVANNVLYFLTGVAIIILVTEVSATVVGAQNVLPRSHM